MPALAEAGKRAVNALEEDGQRQDSLGGHRNTPLGHNYYQLSQGTSTKLQIEPETTGCQARCSEALLYGRAGSSSLLEVEVRVTRPQGKTKAAQRAGRSQMLLQLPQQLRSTPRLRRGWSAQRQAICLEKMVARKHWTREGGNTIVARKGSTMSVKLIRISFTNHVQ